ncbi:MAG: TldD/PmbA family protein [Actinobacteria bacterium]|nr:TldD/PmbA family protein [Actinomycetota bacterium]
MVDPAVLDRTLETALARGGEWAEVFVEDRTANSAHLDDGKIEELSSSRERGAGIRVVVGDSTGFAHTSDLSPEGLTAAARAASSAARSGDGGVRTVALEPLRHAGSPAPKYRPADVATERKIEALRTADEAARATGDAIGQVSAAYADSTRSIIVANSDGRHVADDQVRTRFMVQCTAIGDTGLQTGFDAPGQTVGFELLERHDPAEIARRAARQALVKLDARPAPTGKTTVVLKRGAGGVLFHEACGHGLEADLVGRDASVFKDRIGTRVASPGVNLVDDGTFDTGWGTFAIDDEGNPAASNMLIEDGVLSDYMWDAIEARRRGHAPTGNGRRQSYRHLPMTRMTNTYLLAGDTDPDDIIASTENGIYCVALSGGSVNTATGDFVFGITEAYLIENGVVTAPIRGANLIGNGPASLRQIDAIGNDFDTWAGTCGKDGQGVPVSSGQPTLRVNGMTIGGTASA